jgi:transcriptional regulator with XRE-family HTH domain
MFKYPVINLIETGKNITRLMQKNGLKVTDLQEVFGFEYPQAIYKWKRGECLPTVDNLIILAALFKTTVDEIIVTNYY